MDKYTTYVKISDSNSPGIYGYFKMTTSQLEAVKAVLDCLYLTEVVNIEEFTDLIKDIS